MSIREPIIKHYQGEPVDPKRDARGRYWREIRCLYCRHWIGDEHIRNGRIRVHCPNCDRITVMEFREKIGKGRSLSQSLNQERNQTHEQRS